MLYRLLVAVSYSFFALRTRLEEQVRAWMTQSSTETFAFFSGGISKRMHGSMD